MSRGGPPAPAQTRSGLAVVGLDIGIIVGFPTIRLAVGRLRAFAVSLPVMGFDFSLVLGPGLSVFPLFLHGSSFSSGARTRA
jgi:hypothetical protein